MSVIRVANKARKNGRENIIFDIFICLLTFEHFPDKHEGGRQGHGRVAGILMGAPDRIKEWNLLAQLGRHLSLSKLHIWRSLSIPGSSVCADNHPCVHRNQIMS